MSQRSTAWALPDAPHIPVAIPGRTDASLLRWLLFGLAHAPLALAMRALPAVGTLHAYGVLAFGLFLSLTARDPRRLAKVAAYVAGVEVLWRMTRTGVFWEFGKYSVSLMLVTWVLRNGRFRNAKAPFLYFLLLLPSTALTLGGVDEDLAKRFISFNLSGPLSLMACTLFFAQVRWRAEELRAAMLACAAPVFGIFSVAFFSAATTSDILFTNNSNFATSGGFGPNQVSAILGLGALLIFLVLAAWRADLRTRALLFLGIALFLGQSAFTFSRGGIYNFAGAALAGGLFLLQGRRTRIPAVIALLLLVVIAEKAIVPQLDEMTGGQLTTRFRTTHTSGRDRIVEDDLAIWENNLLLGVGPGMSRLNRISLLNSRIAHTEFSRLLAEHGALGLAAGLVMFFLAARAIRDGIGHQHRAIAASLVAWTFLFMLHSAMRLVAPACMLGLACSQVLEPWHPDPEDDE